VEWQLATLPAAIAGIEAEDASGGTGITSETRQSITQKIFQSRSRIGVGKKAGRYFVVIRSRAANDLGEAGCKVRLEQERCVRGDVGVRFIQGQTVTRDDQEQKLVSLWI
jgi:hypothetical protein